MSLKQSKKIKELQEKIRDFENRLEYECYDCQASQRKGPGWDCEGQCSFHDIRPKTVFYKKAIPKY